ncbi:MAG: DNA-binding response regulator, partial [Proteobacteria bacterium]|nr:DNA-binding response regulator [Pseudomonadota bacterium]
MTKQRVLIIDDEENMRHMLEVLLTKAGYGVESAADGASGLQL